MAEPSTYMDFESPEDALAIEHILHLKKHGQDYQCSQQSRYVAKSESDFTSYVIDKLNEYTQVWNNQWEVEMFSDRKGDDETRVSQYSNKMVFYTTIVWPMEHVIPLDLIPQIQQFIQRLSWNQRFECNMINRIDIDYNRTNRKLSFACDCAFELLEMSRCENCGNCWDGHAQCMCRLQSSSHSIEYE